MSNKPTNDFTKEEEHALQTFEMCSKLLANPSYIMEQRPQLKLRYMKMQSAAMRIIEKNDELLRKAMNLK